MANPKEELFTLNKHKGALTPSWKEQKMETEFLISPKKLYEVEVTDVRCTYRIRYNSQALQIYYYIKDLDKTTSCTFDIPKTLKPLKNTFTSIVGNLVEKHFDDELIFKPNLLAKEVSKELKNKTFMARLKVSPNGRYIDVEEVRLS